MIDEIKLKEQFKQAIGHRIGRSGKAIFHRLGMELLRAGSPYSAPQMIVLAHIFQCEGLNQQKIAYMMHRDKAAATRVIDSLEKANLAVRVPDQKDRRSNLLYLTNEGKETVIKFSETAFKVQNLALKGIDKEDLSTFTKVLEQIRENVEE